jgi:hypothetical protein
MTEPIDADTIYETVPSANLTDLADKLEPIGKDTLSPVETANSAWKDLDSSFKVTGLESISHMLERPEADASDFKSGVEDGEQALRDKVGAFETLEEERPKLVSRVTKVNDALKKAQDEFHGLDSDDPDYSDKESALSDAEGDVSDLREDIRQFNKRVTDTETELGDTLTGISTGTEVQNVGGHTVSKPLEAWDGRVDDMRSLVMSSNDPSFIDSLGDSFQGAVKPSGDGIDKTAWSANHAGTIAAGTSAWFSYFHLGRFAPRKNGKYTSFKDLSPREQGKFTRNKFRNLRNPHNEKAWSAKPNKAASRAKWLKVGKYASRGGNALAFGIGAYEQWSADSGAGYDTDERVGRAATRSALSGGGAVAGAALGAKGGAVVGSFFGPAGTVVGGFAGGLIGGIVGSGAGNWLADKAVDAGGKLASGIGDAVSGAANKLAFWK